MEAKVQKDIIKFLHGKGCYVIKTKPQPGTPVGCPDVLFLLEGFWGALEIKGDSKSKFQPLQEYTIDKLSKWSYARVVHSENYHDIIAELEGML